MPEPKVLPQRNIDNFDRHCDKSPAPPADGRSRAARANVVVVGHVNVENELLGDWSKGSRRAAEGLAVTRICRVDGTDLEAGGCHLDALLSKAVRILIIFWSALMIDIP